MAAFPEDDSQKTDKSVICNTEQDYIVKGAV